MMGFQWAGSDFNDLPMTQSTRRHTGILSEQYCIPTETADAKTVCANCLLAAL